MSLWSDDFTTRSLEELLSSQAENRTWSKELRLRMAALINSRLAKNITWDDYTSTRHATDGEISECKRRASILTAEIVSRSRP